ncbi:MAG: hypothetical protein ACRC1Z_15830 [Waterburya sp.]
MVQLSTEKSGAIEQLNTSLTSEITQEKSKLAENIFKCFLNYFQAVEQVNSGRITFKNQYCISGLLFDKVILNNSESNRDIAIYHHKCLYYHAEYQNQTQWIETQNNLFEDELKKIKLLPQTKDAVVKEYLTRYFTKYLLSKFAQLDSSQEIIWNLADQHGKCQTYIFSITYLEPNKSTLILGRDQTSKTIIFQGEILGCGVISVTENKISKKSLSQFLNWHLNQ